MKKRVLSGMRPTGKLHLGNYLGALANWVGLQDKYECFFFIADWHALTTDYADSSAVKQNSLEVMLDYLAAGLDPDNLPQSDPTKMNFGSGESRPKVWRDIWGSGQGIGAVKQVVPAAALVERLAREYADAKARLAPAAAEPVPIQPGSR